MVFVLATGTALHGGKGSRSGRVLGRVSREAMGRPKPITRGPLILGLVGAGRTLADVQIIGTRPIKGGCLCAGLAVPMSHDKAGYQLAAW